MIEAARDKEAKVPSDPVVPRSHQYFSRSDAAVYFSVLFGCFVFAAMLDCEGVFLIPFVIAVISHGLVSVQILIRFWGKLSRVDYHYIRFGLFCTWVFSVPLCHYLWREEWFALLARHLPRLQL